jgi:hypothetical protein
VFQLRSLGNRIIDLSCPASRNSPSSSTRLPLDGRIVLSEPKPEETEPAGDAA